MSMVDFTKSTFEKIKTQNKSDYKKKEKALMDHFCGEVKKLDGCRNPQTIPYARHWLNKMIEEMKQDRAGKKSELNEILEVLCPTQQCIGQIKSFLTSMEAGKGSAWDKNYKTKTTEAVETLSKMKALFEKALGIDMEAKNEKKIPMEKFKTLVPGR